MALPQQKFREAVFVTLFAHNVGGGSPSNPDFISEQLKITKKHASLALSRVHAMLPQLSLLDQKIEEKAPGYGLARIPDAEKNILRLALYELFFDDAVPSKVSLAEAVRLAKKFCGGSAAKFINALLDAVYKDMNAAETAV